jgi:hypothetical protein
MPHGCSALPFDVHRRAARITARGNRRMETFPE